MRRPTVRTYTAWAAVMAALLLPAPAAGAETAPAAAAAATVIEKVPYAMDASNQAAWWTPVATYKGRGQYTYFAFNEPGSTAATHRPALARRDPDGAWSRLPLLNGDGQQAEFPDDNGHNQPSAARDGSGRLHVFTSMHADSWRYFRTEAPGGDVTDHASELPDQGVGITYPVVTTAPNGDLYLAARVGTGLDRRPGKLYRWDNANSRWSVVATFASALYRSVYPDDLTVDASGRVHLLYEWAKAPATAFRHQLSYLSYDPSTGASNNCHLLGKQLGGSGTDLANLATCTRPANTHVDGPGRLQDTMVKYEDRVEAAVSRGEVVRYTVEPVYAGPRTVPVAFHMKAEGVAPGNLPGERFDVLVPNSLNTQKSGWKNFGIVNYKGLPVPIGGMS
ncbi:BNR-4 repeat-containing protein [[Kitasatospora] papulosa]|uniref:BNR-4 repeat-containing protein n=1 Tax=[Kitasatospora] papulosa TaxID=1464011 RepID=UPI0032474316